MYQDSRVVVTGKSSARFAKMLKSANAVDVSSIELSALAESVRKMDPDSFPDLFIFSQDEHWQDTSSTRQFLSAFDKVIPPVIVIGPTNNPDLMRRAIEVGAKDYLDETVSAPELCVRVEKQLEIIRGSKEMIDNRMIVSISPKGSSESAFLACNLAYINAVLGDWRTAALDLDFQFGSLPFYLDLDLRRSLLQAFDDSDSLDFAALEAHLTQHKSGLFVGGAVEHDISLPGEVSVDSLFQLLKLLNMAFKRVFINLPMLIDPLTSSVLERADKIIIVVEQEIIGLRSSKSLITVLRNDIEIPEDKICVVINNFQKSHQISAKDIQKTLGDAPTYILPEDAATVHESVNTGEPLYQSAPASPISKALFKLAEELNGEPFKRRHGMFGKAFSFFTKN